MTTQSKIEFQFNKQKAIETILYFSNAQAGLSVMHLLKLLYYADLYHLEHYERPIVGGVYYAMQNGPVATNVYELLDKSCDDYYLKPKGRKIKIIIPNRDADLDYFSISDIEAMDYSIEQNKNKTAEDLSQESHKTKAWKNAWDNRNMFEQRSKMQYIDFFETISQERIDYLIEYSGLMVF